MAAFGGSLGRPPELEENLRNALEIKEGLLGEEDVNGFESSFCSSSLSFGEKAAPYGLWSRGPVACGLARPDFRLDCDGGVEPEENFELSVDIQEFLRPVTDFGGVCSVGDGAAGAFCEDADDLLDPLRNNADADDFSSVGSSGAGGGCSFSCSGITSFCDSLFGLGVTFPADGGRAGLLFDRDRRCGLGVAVVGSSSLPFALEFTVEEADFVRER